MAEDHPSKAIMGPLEWLAAALSAAAIWLTSLRRPICWPVNLVASLLYAWVFFVARLYSDALLQIVLRRIDLLRLVELAARAGRRAIGCAARCAAGAAGGRCGRARRFAGVAGAGCPLRAGAGRRHGALHERRRGLARCRAHRGQPGGAVLDGTPVPGQLGAVDCRRRRVRGPVPEPEPARHGRAVCGVHPAGGLRLVALARRAAAAGAR